MAAEPPSTERGVAEIAATLEVENLLARYCMSIDDGRFDDFAVLFSEAGAMHVMGATHRGREAVKGFMSAAQPPEARGRHSIAARVLRIDATAGTGTGCVDYVFFDASGAATNIGRYHDRYVRGADGVWRFELREIVFRGSEPELTDDWG